MDTNKDELMDQDGVLFDRVVRAVNSGMVLAYWLIGRESVLFEIQHPLGTKFSAGFTPQLSWSHYRALMWVMDKKEH